MLTEEPLKYAIIILSFLTSGKGGDKVMSSNKRRKYIAELIAAIATLINAIK